ncbi:diguanylate cyclase (GGDEF)-like protein [Rhizobium alvei]|uniref:EAL domain-containing protein n=2 Tax=Rhizobium alvei TaxID=1132659 RepID=A0ABT8YM60_9HYPH|nr:EAL domain-containing protein [Rhizobium alvei]MDO6964389.1 EAL domain-containing protein [Rhizobium alvei]
MSVQSENPELLKAQYRAFTRQMPMMYFILLSSTWALAMTHVSLAPVWLTIGVPSVLTFGCLLRVLFWFRTRNVTPSPEFAHAALQRTNRLAGLIAVAFTLWSFALIPYGDAYTRSHVAFYMAITVISCIFCLMYVRSAAFIVTLIVNGAFIAFFVSTAQPTFVAIAINILLVCAGMMTILLTNYRNFESMVVAKQRSDALSCENFRLANLDSLTGLANRRAFFADLEYELEKARASGNRLALGVMDLDGFKPVNDLYGHSVGDRLLIEVANRLSNTLTASTPYRLGGDEFAIIAALPPEDAQLVINANRVSARLREPYPMPEGTVHVSASMGIAVFPDLALNREQLFDRADYALYHAKKRLRGGAVLFNTDHEHQINLEARIESVLKQADLEKELSVVFQPIVDIRDGSTIGFEALARWDSPTLGKVSPASFIPIAERAGMIGSLTRPLFRKALDAAISWDAPLRLSFNLSAHDLNAADGVLAIIGIIETSGFDPKRLDLEITETAFTHDFEQVTQSVETLRRLGCGISLDDFGTGYSSLTRLHALPLTKFKIDRSFVTNLHQSPASYKIVKSLLTLSADMGLDCVIEGVETEEELEALKALGGTSVQGYLFSPPLPEEQAMEFAARTSREDSKIAV